MSQPPSSTLPAGDPHRPLLWLVSLAIFMQMLDSTIVIMFSPSVFISSGSIS